MTSSRAKKGKHLAPKTKRHRPIDDLDEYLTSASFILQRYQWPRAFTTNSGRAWYLIFFFFVNLDSMSTLSICNKNLTEFSEGIGWSNALVIKKNVYPNLAILIWLKYFT